MTTRVNAYTPEELEAYRLEGLAPANAEQMRLIRSARKIQDRIKELEAQLKAAKDILNIAMTEADVDGLIWAGEQVAWRIEVEETERFDEKTFREKNPEVAAVWMVPKKGYTYVKLS